MNTKQMYLIGISADYSSNDNPQFVVRFQSTNSGQVFRFYLLVEHSQTTDLISSLFRLNFESHPISQLWEYLYNSPANCKTLIRRYSQNPYLVEYKDCFLSSVRIAPDAFDEMVRKKFTLNKRV